MKMHPKERFGHKNEGIGRAQKSLNINPYTQKQRYVVAVMSQFGNSIESMFHFQKRIDSS